MALRWGVFVQVLSILLAMEIRDCVADPSSENSSVINSNPPSWRSQPPLEPSASSLQQTPTSPAPPAPPAPAPTFPTPPMPSIPPALSIPTPSHTLFPQSSSSSLQGHLQPTSTQTGQTEIMTRWLDQTRMRENLIKYILKRKPNKISDYSCEGRCGKEQRKLPEQEKWWLTYTPPKCFCDKECLLLKDCCYDFKDSCKNISNSSTTDSDAEKSSPVCKSQVQHAKHLGYVMINSCPLPAHHSRLSKLCSNVKYLNRTNVLTSVPALDLASNTSYGNVFCAACNERRLKNLLMWRVKASCNRTLSEDVSPPELIEYASKQCTISFSPTSFQPESRHRVCVPRLHDRHYASNNDSSDAQKLEELCGSYAFPVCAIAPDKAYHWFKNPHCLLLQGIFDMQDANIVCPSSDIPLPPLTIFFDFRSTTSYVIERKLKDEDKPKTLFEKKFECKTDHVFDAFSGGCRRIFDREATCDLVELEKSEFIISENGSLWFRGTIHTNESFFKINGSIFVCASAIQNFTVLESRSKPRSSDVHTMTFLTISGCALSLVSLLLLMISYWVLPDLRNVPGKIILGIATSMFAYLLLYFFTNRNENPMVCFIIAVCLHFFFLSMFFWMNVMAFDIHGTFTRKGNVDFNRRSAGCCTGLYFKYALYALLVPLLIVIVSVGLDKGHMFIIYTGYAPQGNQYCVINNPHAKLYTVALPVGLILLYNCVALCHTVIHIKKVRKQTSTVASQSQQPGLPVVCIKMTTVIGVSWILGYFASSRSTAFLWYPYVVLNSLQGFLIFISYVLNRRVLKMYKGIFQDIRGKHSSVASKRSTNISPAS